MTKNKNKKKESKLEKKISDVKIEGVKNTQFLKEFFLVLGFFLVLTYLYLSPGSSYLFEGSQNFVLSDGTDQLTAPYVYNLAIQRWIEHPLEILYGAVYTDKLNPPFGFVMWTSWIEKIFLLLSLPFIQVEQTNAAISFFFILISAISMYGLSRFLNWNKWVSIGLGMSWGFNAFTLARSKVHPGFTALFFLPLLFIALKMIKEKMSLKEIVFSSILLVFSVMGPQYFTVTTVFLTLFWMGYLYIQKGDKKNLFFNAIKVSILPVLFLSWTVLMPVSSELKNKVQELYPKSGEAEAGVHPFMYQFAAEPIDYLSGNLGITLSDVNPIKETINHSIYEQLAQKGSNNHEHSVGIRWVLFIFVFIAIYLIVKRKTFFEVEEKKEILFFLALAIFTFYLSLSPTIFGFEVGPSLWLHKLVSQIRVPSRASVYVHFSVLMITGIFINRIFSSNQSNNHSESNFNVKKLKFLKYLFPILIFLEFPPIYDMPINQILPTPKALQEKNCGLGMYFPYVSASFDLMTFYQMQQTLRHSTDCELLNSISPLQNRDPILLNNFAKHPMILNKINQGDARIADQLVSFTQCMNLEWIYFDAQVPTQWKKQVCDRLSWQLIDDQVCKTSFENRPFLKEPAECLR